MIECPKRDWLVLFGHQGLCYRRTTAGTFVLDLLYSRENIRFLNFLDCNMRPTEFLVQ